MVINSNTSAYDEEDDFPSLQRLLSPESGPRISLAYNNYTETSASMPPLNEGWQGSQRPPVPGFYQDDQYIPQSYTQAQAGFGMTRGPSHPPPSSHTSRDWNYDVAPGRTPHMSTPTRGFGNNGGAPRGQYSNGLNTSTAYAREPNASQGYDFNDNANNWPAGTAIPSEAADLYGTRTHDWIHHDGQAAYDVSAPRSNQMPRRSVQSNVPPQAFTPMAQNLAYQPRLRAPEQVSNARSGPRERSPAHSRRSTPVPLQRARSLSTPEPGTHALSDEGSEGNDAEGLNIQPAAPHQRATGAKRVTRAERLRQFKESEKQVLSLLKLPELHIPKWQRARTPREMYTTATKRGCRLKPHQKVGLTQLIRNEEDSNKKGSILADGMGLGKTIEALALILARPSPNIRRKTTLVMGPLSLLEQWKTEIETTVGDHLKTLVIHGQAPKPRPSHQEMLKYDIVLASWGILQNEYRLHCENKPKEQRYQALLLHPGALFYRVILDEAHMIKKKTTKMSEGAALLQSQYRLAMTGTPLMNEVAEIFPLIRFLGIKPYNQWLKFMADIGSPLRKWEGDEKAPAMRKLQLILASLMIRRVRTTLIDGKPALELDPIRETVHFAHFSEDEQEFYTAIEKQVRITKNKYLRGGATVPSFKVTWTHILRMRQAANHPYLVKNGSIPEGCSLSVSDMIEMAGALSPEAVETWTKADKSVCPMCGPGGMDIEELVIIVPCGHHICTACYNGIALELDIAGDKGQHGKVTRCPARHCDSRISSRKIIMQTAFGWAHDANMTDQLAPASGHVIAEPPEDNLEDDSEEGEQYEAGSQMTASSDANDSGVQQQDRDLEDIFDDVEKDTLDQGQQSVDDHHEAEQNESAAAEDVQDQPLVEHHDEYNGTSAGEDILEQGKQLSEGQWDVNGNPQAGDTQEHAQQSVEDRYEKSATPDAEDDESHIQRQESKNISTDLGNTEDEEEEQQPGENHSDAVPEAQEDEYSDSDDGLFVKQYYEESEYEDMGSDDEDASLFGGGSEAEDPETNPGPLPQYDEAVDDREPTTSPGVGSSQSNNKRNITAYLQNRASSELAPAKRQRMLGLEPDNDVGGGLAESFDGPCDDPDYPEWEYSSQPHDGQGSREEASSIPQMVQPGFNPSYQPPVLFPNSNQPVQTASKVPKYQAQAPISFGDFRNKATKSWAAKERYRKYVEATFQHSAKTIEIMRLLNDIRTMYPEDKVLIFSNWTSFLDILKVPIKRAGFNITEYNGSVDMPGRKAAVKFFDEDPDRNLMLLSVATGALGLNLMSANHVIIAEPFWNPFLEEQAIDRVNRMGQEKQVHVYHVMVAGTIEDRIVAIQAKKKKMASTAISDGFGAGIYDLSEQEIKDIFGFK